MLVLSLHSHRTLESLEAYTKTADLGETNNTQLVQPLLALNVRDFSETTSVIGFGTHVGSDMLTNESLALYNQPSELNISQSEVAILFSHEVMKKAEIAHGMRLSQLTHMCLSVDGLSDEPFFPHYFLRNNCSSTSVLYEHY